LHVVYCPTVGTLHVVYCPTVGTLHVVYCPIVGTLHVEYCPIIEGFYLLLYLPHLNHCLYITLPSTYIYIHCPV